MVPVLTSNGEATELHENAKRLAASRMLAAIVESSTDAIISKTLDGIIRSWNAAAEILFGYPAEQAIGRHISLIIPEDRAQEEDEIVRRIRAGERVDHFETVRVRSDGQLIHVSLTISPITDDAGRIVGASKIARDITDRKQAEERIYALLAELKEADQLKDEFLAILGHELRNPMAPLSHMLQIMKRSEGDNTIMQEARTTMERQLVHLVRLVDDLVDVSRITRGKLELRKETVELAPILRQAVEACGPMAEASHLRIDLSLPEEPVYLRADAVRLAQVFGNLLNNACKFSEPAGRVTVTAARERGEVAVRVRDEGVGIPPDKLETIFGMFSQVDRTLERTQSGLGIGLTLVERLIGMLGGTVTAHSAGRGRGSEFVVRLPVLADSQRPRPDVPTPDPIAAPRRILVVDDNADAASSLAMLLRITGNTTYVAHDGIEAVRQAEEHRPDVVLLDVGLPRLNGYDACRRIREKPWGGGMVIIAMTGWGAEGDRQRSREAGFDHHMVKPVDYEKLMSLLAQPRVAR